MQTKNNNYIYIRDGMYYFSRRVPEDLKSHYRLNRIVFSLRTRSLKTAQAQAISLASKLDNDWQSLRWQSSSNSFSRFMIDCSSLDNNKPAGPKLSEAKVLYLTAKGKGRSITFKQSVERSVGYQNMPPG